jgi:hypothetical protein
MVMTRSKRNPRPSKDNQTEGTRVIFDFDEENLEVLRRMTNQFQFEDMGETVRQSLRVVFALREQAKEGYTQVVVRNPSTQGEKILVSFASHSGSDTM